MLSGPFSVSGCEYIFLSYANLLHSAFVLPSKVPSLPQESPCSLTAAKIFATVRVAIHLVL